MLFNSALKMSILVVKIYAMKSLTAIFLIAFFCYSFQSNAQKDEKKKDPKYIEGIKYTVSLHPFYLNQSTMISLNDIEGDLSPVVYRPNLLGGITLAAQYRFISLSYAVPIRYSAENIDNFGESDLIDVTLGIQTRSFGFKLYLQKYNGFYQDNKAGFYPEYDMSIDHPIREDITTFSFGFYNHFIFSRSFSMRAAFESSELQKKSRGAPMLLIAERFTKMTSDSSLIPFASKNDFPELYGMYSGAFNTIIVAPGFGYTALLGPLSLTPVILMGGGIQNQYYRIHDEETGKNKRKPGLKLSQYTNIKVALGFNTPHFFLRFVYGYDMNSLPYKNDYRFKMTHLRGEASIGLRW
jgi:hypothetical protein